MSKRILIIEDNEDLARLPELHLRNLSHEITFSFEGPEAFGK